MQRISVVGNPGSGKSTLARCAAERLGHARLELDSVYHQPGWAPLPEEDLRGRVDAFIDTHERWVIDGDYSAVRERVRARADAVIWLDPERLPNLQALLWRTVKRAALRQELLGAPGVCAAGVPGGGRGVARAPARGGGYSPRQPRPSQ
jgi:adenylate kinase family enzyme